MNNENRLHLDIGTFILCSWYASVTLEPTGTLPVETSRFYERGVPAMSRDNHPSLEQLEDRSLPTTYGIPLPDLDQLSPSFAPAGEQIAEPGSDLLAVGPVEEDPTEDPITNDPWIDTDEDYYYPDPLDEYDWLSEEDVYTDPWWDGDIGPAPSVDESEPDADPGTEEPDVDTDLEDPAVDPDMEESDVDTDIDDSSVDPDMEEPDADPGTEESGEDPSAEPDPGDV